MTVKKFVTLWVAAFAGSFIALLALCMVNAKSPLCPFFAMAFVITGIVGIGAFPILLAKGAIVVHRGRVAERARAALTPRLRPAPPVRPMSNPRIPAPNITSGDVFLEPYYAREFARLRNGEQCRFNVAACFFGALWCMYRGLWLTAIAGMVVAVVTGGIAIPFLWLAWGARGNYLYFCLLERGEQKVL